MTEEKHNKLNKTDLITILAPSILFAFMLAIFAPFEIYLSNKGYFFFEGSEMLGGAVCLFVLLLVLCIVILLTARLIHTNLFKLVYGMFIGGTFALYLQGNWDSTDYGAWNGSEIDWSKFLTQKWIFIIIFLLLITVGALCGLKASLVFNKLSTYGSVFLTLVLISTLVTLLISNSGLGKADEYIATTEDELRLSGKQNMLILVLDAYDSQAFEDLLNSERGKEYREDFQDFTYYPNTLGAYSSTDMSMPLIITGEGYKNDILFGEHLDRAYAGSKLMNWLKENEWETDIYSDILMPQGNNGAGINNSRLLKRVVSDRRALMNYMYTMVLFRYMPQPIKNHFYFYADNIKGTLNSVAGDYEPYSEDNFVFYDKIDALEASNEEANGVFQLVHITGAHEPFTFTSEFTEIDGETSYEEECEGILVAVNKFFSKLKEKDLYDNSVIFIMADHGYYDSRQNPLLLIKGYNDKHELCVSDVAVSYYDLQSGYIRLLESICNGEDVFDMVGDEDRGRDYAFVPWNTHLNFDTYSGSFSEVTFRGHARDNGSYENNGVRYEEPSAVGLK